MSEYRILDWELAKSYLRLQDLNYNKDEEQIIPKTISYNKAKCLLRINENRVKSYIVTHQLSRNGKK